MLHEGRRGAEGQLHLAGQQVLQRRAGALVRHVHHLDAGLLLQHGARHVLQRAVARRGVVQLARVGLGVGHQLGQRLGGHVVAHHDDLRRRQDVGDGLEVGQLPLALLHQVRRDDVKARVLHQQRVAIGRRTLDDGRRNGAVAAALVVDHHLLARHCAQALRQHAAGQVGGAAGGGGHDQGDGLGRIALRQGAASHQCGGQGDEMLAGQLHGECLLLTMN